MMVVAMTTRRAGRGSAGYMYSRKPRPQAATTIPCLLGILEEEAPGLVFAMVVIDAVGRLR